MNARVAVFLVLISAVVCLFAVEQSNSALTVTKTKLFGDRNVVVYRADVAFDNSYAAGGETLDMSSKMREILFAVMESHGFATADTVAYFINPVDSAFSSGTMELMVYQVGADTSVFMEVPEATDLSGVANASVIIWGLRKHSKP